jgi:sulfur carrier protein ThiS
LVSVLVYGQKDYYMGVKMIWVNYNEHPWREGMTINDLLEDLQDGYPYAIIRINDEQVTCIEFDKKIIPDNAKIILVPLISGG